MSQSSLLNKPHPGLHLLYGRDVIIYYNLYLHYILLRHAIHHLLHHLCPCPEAILEALTLIDFAQLRLVDAQDRIFFLGFFREQWQQPFLIAGDQLDQLLSLTAGHDPAVVRVYVSVP